MTRSLFEMYVQSMRSKPKRAYAVAYRRFLQGITKTEPERGELSAMAAQAVRMELHTQQSIEAAKSHSTHLFEPNDL